MGGDGGNVIIPAVSVGEFTASDLIRYSFQNNPRYTIVLSGEIKSEVQYGKLFSISQFFSCVQPILLDFRLF